MTRLAISAAAVAVAAVFRAELDCVLKLRDESKKVRIGG